MLYSERFVANAEFYLHFLLPEFRAFVQSRRWAQPTIGCLGYAGIPVKGADYSLPLYSLDDPLHRPLSPTTHRISMEREVSNESCSTVLSFFSCAQGNDHEYYTYTSADQMTLSRPLIDEQKFAKDKSENQSEPSPRDRCCCCQRSHFICCC
jgi:hypothetical protein